jgi:hypothetical protein
VGCILKKKIKKFLGCKAIAQIEKKKNSTLNVTILDLDIFLKFKFPTTFD